MGGRTWTPESGGWTGRACPECRGTGTNESARGCQACGGTGDEYAPPASKQANARVESPHGEPPGLYAKFVVFKTYHLTWDQYQALVQHDPPPLGGDLFVLRFDRDPHARAALAAYADSCAASNPVLAGELRAQLARLAPPRRDET